MSNGLEAWERDLEWLKDHFGRYDENEGEAFCERVAVLVAEGLAETTARYKAMVMIRDARVQR